MSIAAPLTPLFLVIALANLLQPEIVVVSLGRVPAPILLAVVVVFLGAVAVSLVVGLVPRRGPTGPPTVLAPPINGRCRALNSPVDKVPSHGTHSYGQSEAIDLLHDPEDGTRPSFGDGHGFQRPEVFPAFGQPITAPCAGQVVAIAGRARDHRARTSWLAYGYLAVEALLRPAGGVRAVIGNHVIIARDRGGFVLVAHLRRGSAVVEVGDRVSPGQVLAQVGNSGNSSEPHIHLQVMDHRRPTIAAGLPFEFPAPPSGHPDRDARDAAAGAVVPAAGVATAGAAEPDLHDPGARGRVLPASGAVVMLGGAAGAAAGPASGS